MGYFTHFFVASPEDAILFDALARSEEPLPPARFQCVIVHMNLTPLELEMLWAVLDNEDLIPAKHQLTFIDTGSEGSALHSFPEPFTLALSRLDDAGIRRVAESWARFEEVPANHGQDVEPLLRDLRLLAAEARQDGKSLYIWIYA